MDTQTNMTVMALGFVLTALAVEYIVLRRRYGKMGLWDLVSCGALVNGSLWASFLVIEFLLLWKMTFAMSPFEVLDYPWYVYAIGAGVSVCSLSTVSIVPTGLLATVYHGWRRNPR
jgi:hypothetical protein